MTAVIPNIHVYTKKTQLINAPMGMANKVALIGAFDSAETSPRLFETVGDAQAEMGTDTTFNGCVCIEPIFLGASSLLCVNTNVRTESGGSTTDDKEMTVNKLTEALAKIKGEDFDIIYVAETLTDTFIPIITAFLDECYEMKNPAGFVGIIAGSSASANVTSAGLAGEHCYGLLTQSFEVDGTWYSLLKSGAYYTGLVAGTNVGNSMTMKEVYGVTNVSPEYTFEVNSETGVAIDDGAKLVQAGITVLKCQDRTNKRYVVVNSEQPNGYDLYINRVRNYVVKSMALHKFLGERNRQATLNEIDHELASVKNKCVNALDLLEDINYDVQRKDANCVEILIDSLVFTGIITNINVYVKIEVQ